MGYVPDKHLNFASWELAEALRPLSQQQVNAIFRIVLEEGHIVDDPLAPYHLFFGDAKICSKEIWVRRERTTKTGRVLKPGWSHQEPFVTALQLAKRLARQCRVMVAKSAMAEAAELAQIAGPDVVRNMVSVATGKDGVGNLRDVSDADQVRAGALVWKIASDAANDTAEQSDIENDWWNAGSYETE